MDGSVPAESIWKFPLETVTTQGVTMPEGAEILSVQVQYGTPCLWAKVDPSKANRVRMIVIHGTGHAVKSGLKFIGTYQLEGGQFIGHAFEKIGD